MAPTVFKTRLCSSAKMGVTVGPVVLLIPNALCGNQAATFQAQELALNRAGAGVHILHDLARIIAALRMPKDERQHPLLTLENSVPERLKSSLRVPIFGIFVPKMGMIQ